MMNLTIRMLLAIVIAGTPFALAGHAQAQADENVPLMHETSDTTVELTPEAEAAIKAGLEWLSVNQRADGAFPSNWGPNMGISALSLIAFLACGHVPGQGMYGEVLDRGIDFAITNAGPSGFVSCKEGESGSPMYEHALGTLFLAETQGMTNRTEITGILQGAVRVIVNSQNGEGGWRYQPRVHDADLSVTVMQIIALRACKNAGIDVPKSTIDNAIRYVRSCAHGSGGFTYQRRSGEPGFGTTAAGVTSLEVCGDYTSDDVIKGLDFLLAKYKVDSDHWHYGIYYTAQALYQAKDEKRWQQWYPIVREDLLAKQQADGHWDSPYGAAYGTAMSLLVLSVPYRVLPIYQR